MARKVTIKAFEAWIADEANERDVLERIAGGMTLQKASVAVKQPYTCLYAYFRSTPEREARYVAARKSWADAKQDEIVEIVETVAPDRDHVAKARLRAEVIGNQAKAYNRERWGEKVQHEVDGRSAVVDAALLGTATELLRLARERARPAIEVKPVLVEGDEKDAVGR